LTALGKIQVLDEHAPNELGTARNAHLAVQTLSVCVYRVPRNPEIGGDGNLLQAIEKRRYDLGLPIGQP